MDIRADVQRTYRSSYELTADCGRALVAAAERFTDLAGYTPDKALMDKLLAGAMLGRDHPLMKLLDAPRSRGGTPDRGLPASGLRPGHR